MQLSEDRFYKGQFNFKRCANGPLESTPIYSYESKDKLYDVVFIGDSMGCRINGAWVTPNQYHNAIISHFNLT
jgi:hypothetical protein